MKRTVTIGLLGAILAIAVGFIGTNAISATPFLIAANQATTNDSGLMIGHVEYTVRDATGQIKQYVQGDNLIVTRGTDCTGQKMFNNTNTDICTPSVSGDDGFYFIAIGNGTAAAVPGDTQLADDSGGHGCAGTGDICEMDRKAGVVTFDTSGDDTIVTISNSRDPFTFTGISSGGDVVGQSGLFDDLTGDFATDNMFAMRDVSVSVNAADTLAVTWKITLQGQ